MFVAQLFNHPFIFWLYNENRIFEFGDFYFFFFLTSCWRLKASKTTFFEFLISAFWRNSPSKKTPRGVGGEGGSFVFLSPSLVVMAHNEKKSRGPRCFAAALIAIMRTKEEGPKDLFLFRCDFCACSLALRLLVQSFR